MFRIRHGTSRNRNIISRSKLRETDVNIFICCTQYVDRLVTKMDKISSNFLLDKVKVGKSSI